MTTAAAVVGGEVSEGYWSAALGPDVRPSWRHLSLLEAEGEPMRIVGRSRFGLQIVCVSKERVYVMMFWNSAWGVVGGALRTGDGDFVRPERLAGVMFVDQGAAVEELQSPQQQGPEPARVLLLFKATSWRDEVTGKRLYDAVGVLDTAAHAQDEADSRGLQPAAFRWVRGEAERRSLAGKIARHVKERAQCIRVAFGDEQLRELLRIDGEGAPPAEVRLLDYVPVFRVTAIPRPNMHGRPRFSLDRKERSARSVSLTEAQEVRCMGLLLATLCTVYYGSPCDLWRVGVEVQVLYAQTEGFRILRRVRSMRCSRVAQLRRWLTFCKQLAQATDGFKRALEDGEAFARGVERPVWAAKRAPPVSAFVHQWLADGCMAAPLFTATCLERQTAGVTAREWMRLHFVELRAEAERMASGDGLLALSAAPVREGASERALRVQVLEPYLERLHNLEVTVLTKVHQGIAVAGAKSQATRDEHLRRVEGLFRSLGQNVATHMRSCKGVADVVCRLRALVGRVQGVTKDNRRVQKELEVAAGCYAEEVAQVGRLVDGAMAGLNQVTRDEVRSKVGVGLLTAVGVAAGGEEAGLAMLCDE